MRANCIKTAHGLPDCSTDGHIANAFLCAWQSAVWIATHTAQDALKPLHARQIRACTDFFFPPSEPTRWAAGSGTTKE